MPEDKILIKDLMVRGIVGVNDWEREKKQDILVNIVIWADLSEAGATDDLEKSVDYRAVTKEVIALLEAARRYTVEALAADIAKICLAKPGALRARVRVEKPGALRFADSVGVEIERSAADLE